LTIDSYKSSLAVFRPESGGAVLSAIRHPANHHGLDKSQQYIGEKVGGSLGPAAPRVEAFHPLIAAAGAEPLVEHLELRLDGIGHRILADNRL